jgi:hypothetical protein
VAVEKRGGGAKFPRRMSRILYHGGMTAASEAAAEATMTTKLSFLHLRSTTKVKQWPEKSSRRSTIKYSKG